MADSDLRNRIRNYGTLMGNKKLKTKYVEDIYPARMCVSKGFFNVVEGDKQVVPVLVASWWTGSWLVDFCFHSLS